LFTQLPAATALAPISNHSAKRINTENLEKLHKKTNPQTISLPMQIALSNTQPIKWTLSIWMRPELSYQRLPLRQSIPLSI
jgi:hypothetical protein